MEQKVIKEFCIDFFKFLNADVTVNNDSIIARNAHDDFERFVGKKSPYILTFDASTHEKIEDSELIAKGSYILKAMRDYIGDFGETSILRANKEIINELKNIKINDNYLLCFTFISTIEHLNKREQSISSFITSDDKIINIDITKYKLKDETSYDTLNINPDKAYDLCKKELKKIINKKTKKIKKELKEKLAKELYRIKNHYQNQLSEKDEDLENNKRNLELLNHHLDRAYEQSEKTKLIEKIKRAQDIIEKLKKDDYVNRIDREKDFFIKDETYKHSLNITNQLINVSVILF